MSVGTSGAIQVPPPAAGVLGQGITYPPTVDSKGRLALSWGVDLVTQSIQSICVTQPFERVMQPDYGAATETFEPADLARMQTKLEEQIAAHEPRAEKVSVTVQPSTNGEVLTIVAFTVRGEATERTLTFPLYTPPALTGSSA